MALVVLTEGCCVCPGGGSRGSSTTRPAPTASATAKPAPPAPAPAPAPAGTVTARVVVDAYKKNERAADARWKGKKLRVSGWIAELSPGHVANPVIAVGATASTDPLEDAMVACRVTDALVGRVSTLRRRAFIVVEGEIEGKRFGQIRLEECVIVSGGT